MDNTTTDRHLPGADGGLLPENTAASTRPIRVLLVEDDAGDAVRIHRCLQGQIAADSRIDRVDTLAGALRRLEQDSYDLFLLDLTLPDSEGIDALNAVAQRHGSTPILVLSDKEQPDDVQQAICGGAHQFLYKSRLNGEFLGAALRNALSNSGDREPGSSDAAGRIETSVERRADPRYLIAASAVVYPIEKDGRPGPDIAATVIDLSRSGIGVLAESHDDRSSDLAFVGIEQANGIYRYATVRWRHCVKQPEGLRMGGSFVGKHEDPFERRKLTPRLNTATLRLEPALRSEVLYEWAMLGVARPYLIDRIKVCPKCKALPTFRDGCSQCGSARTASAQLVHHFACAHVDFAAEYEQQGTLACPKCRARNLIVGTDFEYLDGPLRCLDCEASADEASLIGECLKCGLRFPGSEAFDDEVIQFHVERLDPLAFISEAG